MADRQGEAAAPAAVPELAEIRRRIAADGAVRTDGDGRHAAATALILHESGRGPEVLFIRRSERAGDPWAGHVALPGGRREPGDDDLVATAVRETAEEVGVALDAPFGQLESVSGRTRTTAVATYVFAVDPRPELVLEASEVARAMWVPLGRLLDDDRRTRHPVRGVGPFPGIRLGDDVLWGLTLRTMEHFFAAIGRSLR